MKRRTWFWRGLLAGAAALLGAGSAGRAEESKLEAVHLEQPEPGKPVSAEYRRYFSRMPQYFRFSGDGDAGDDFKEAVKKEPEKYLAESALRGAAKLGAKQYGFALDKQSEDSKSYDRLYFDLNGNGDLTDDKPIDAIAPEPPKNVYETKEGEKAVPKAKEGKKDGKKTTVRPRIIRTQTQVVRFPRVDMTLEADGKPYEYSFFFNVYARLSGDRPMAQASLSPAVYYRGEMTLGGKTLPIALVDNNSNGRFDDEINFREVGSKGQIAPQYGDALLIDPEKMTPVEMIINRGSSEHRQWLTKINQIEGKYYGVKASPSGTSLDCSPFAGALGKIAGSQTFSDLKLIGKQGFIDLRLEKTQPAEVPAGDWRMSSYVLQVDDWKPPEKEKKEVEEKGEKAEADDPNSLLQSALKKVNKPSTLTAYGTGNGKIIHVEADQTTELKFGPPYKINLTHASQPGTVNFSLALAGAEGERVTSITVNGKTPSPPTLTITDPKGEVIHEGKFKFG